MADPALYSCNCETTDSGLSIAANVISILTLAWTSYIGIIFYMQSTSGVPNALHDIRNRITTLNTRIQNIRKYKEDLNEFETSRSVAVLQTEVGCVARKVYVRDLWVEKGGDLRRWESCRDIMLWESIERLEIGSLMPCN
ncbi:hypothetical protein FB567DRAFT_553248 [Paraphoma chrysanthemicola]|uniref:Uncharacterized protein n=1 Tax=Paraphoma chrysanthemicola TaxID=798071 RepID=A0A8K0VUW4_9PLEO|nr:hypothetical protein FB567DRAFT_553248 [Paraphoma chrysanthemicola]